MTWLCLESDLSTGFPDDGALQFKLKLATTGQTKVWQAAPSTYICSVNFRPRFPLSLQSGVNFSMSSFSCSEQHPKNSYASHCVPAEEVSATAEMAFLILTSSSFLPSGLQISFKASSWSQARNKSNKGHHE